jgi:hypothetical protein
MPTLASVSIEAAPVAKGWITPTFGGPKLKPSGGGLSHVYTTDAKVLAEADWTYLQVVLVAWQIHPATVAELAALGPVGGSNAKRWTIEGPLSHQPDDPGDGNCTVSVEIAHSMTSDPGTDWRPYVEGKYRLRSVKARVTITRPSTAYSFRIARLALVAERVGAQQRPRRVHAGVSEVLASGMSWIVSRDFEVIGSLEIESDAYLEII